MRRRLIVLFATLCGPLGLAAPVSAEGPVQVSLGYSYVKYLETGGGSAPAGAFLALSGRDGLSPEVDLGWQRDSEDGFTLNTFTAVVGPRYGFATNGAVRPFLHVMGGVRHDRIEGESNTAWGGFAGGGFDIGGGGSVAIRLGADFQIFFDEGENLKTLRLGVGLTF